MFKAVMYIYVTELFRTGRFQFYMIPHAEFTFTSNANGAISSKAEFELFLRPLPPRIKAIINILVTSGP